MVLQFERFVFVPATDRLFGPVSILLRCIINAARLIAGKIDRSGFEAGYNWCVEQLRNANHSKLANEVELAKAGHYLAMQDFDKAIAVFKVRCASVHRNVAAISSTPLYPGQSSRIVAVEQELHVLQRLQSLLPCSSAHAVCF